MKRSLNDIWQRSSRSLTKQTISQSQPSRCFKNAPAAAVFDQKMKLTQRSQSCRMPDVVQYDYVREMMASHLVERLDDIKRKFPIVADIGCLAGHVANHLPPHQSGITQIVQCDSSRDMLDRAYQSQLHHSPAETGRTLHYVQCEEDSLPLASATYDLILSSGSLHWQNDLPGVFASVRHALKPDGAFMCNIIGGSTLQELRSAFSVVDQERDGTFRTHLSPFVDGRSLSDLLSGAGLALPTIDATTVTVRYPDMFTLMHHLRCMGETQAPMNGVPAMPPAHFLAAAAAYEELYKDADGLIPATLQIFSLIAWAPHESQPKPKARGSARHRLEEISRMAKEAQNQQRKS